MQNNLKMNIVASVMLIIVGIGFLLNNFINDERDQVYSEINMSILKNKEESENVNIDFVDEEADEEETSTSIEEENQTNIDNSQVYEYYIATLEIPKIDFSRGFYDKSSSLNKLYTNIKMLNESSYPDEDNGNVIIAGHSGNYFNSYFGNLWKLSIGDVAYINYKNIKYEYKIVNIYTEAKDGDVLIKRNPNKSVLTLITCTKDDETTQTIYILERV